jgi:hypothetical protein
MPDDKHIRIKNKMRKLIIILICLMVLPIVGAVSYPQFSTIEFTQPCTNSTNAPCSSLAVCNITISYPNGTKLINGKSMTNGGYEHNFTLTNSLTGNIGNNYEVCVNCNEGDGKEYGNECSPFDITSTGDSAGPQWIIVLISIIICWIVFAFARYTEDDAWGFMSGMLFCIVGGYVIWVGFGWKNLMTDAIGMVHVAIGLILIVLSALNFGGEKEDNDNEE